MNATAQTIPPFSMPMFRSFVPERIRPLDICFHRLYLPVLRRALSGHAEPDDGRNYLMREDLQMCLYANLAGMAIYFPLLFRMKFRFTNKTLLCGAATGVLLCNLLAPHITFFACTVGGVLHRRHVQDTRHV